PDIEKMKALWQQLEARAVKFFADANFAKDRVHFRYQVNMRYAGQNFAVSFDVHKCQGEQDYGFLNDSFTQQALQAFNKRHMEEFDHIREAELPEITGVRLISSATAAAPPVGKGFSASPVEATPAKSRHANLGQGYQETPVFDGRNLHPGHKVPGPAIIEETFTTIVVYPGWTAYIDDSGDYEMRKIAR